MGAIAAAALLTFLCGCGLFDLRNPEDPGSGTQVPFEIPTEPRIALQNLKATTEARVITNFDRSLASDYHFRFDPFEAPSDTVWTRDRDIQALTALFRNEATVRLDWAVSDSGTIGNDRFYRNLGYRVVFRLSATDSVVLGGNCTMYFRLEQQQWLIYRWADVKVSGDPNVYTWGYARLNPNFGP
jgi:hypothetical protein